MNCAVAMANSPVFSASPRLSSMFYKPSVSSPASLSRNETSSPPPSSSSPPTPSCLSSPPSSSTCTSSGALLAPLALRVHRQLNDVPVCSSPTSSASSMVLKRKRPSRIDIPVASLSFLTVETPAPLDRLNEVEFEGDAYSVYCKRGKRGVMEDRYSALVNIHGDSKQALFGVFDGHGGGKAADFAAKNLDRNIINEVSRRCRNEIELAVKEGYCTTDAEFLKEDVSGGTCCVTALIREGDLIVSNAGDCRVVMSQRGVAEALTVDHRPSRKDERDRIENQGGYVDCCHGVWRIQGSLAVSRGIGDRNLKRWVTAEPETKVLTIRPECEFLILASDGLWEKVSAQEAVDIVRPLCIGVDSPKPLAACKKLAGLSVTRGSTDDITIMVIQLAHFLP